MRLFTIGRIFVLMLIAVPLHSGWAAVKASDYERDYDVTYTGPWRTSEDIVKGWDWTLPPGVEPAARSGIFNSNTDYPSDFPGNKLTQVNATWRELEPAKGKYQDGGTFATLKNKINDPHYDGAMLNIRFGVWKVEKANCGGAACPNDYRRTAPDWLNGGNPATITEGYQPWNGRIIGVDISKDYFQEGLADLFDALKRAGVPQMPKLKFVIIHGPSHSRGEEWSGKQSKSTKGQDAMMHIIDLHVEAFSPDNVWKLGWPKHHMNELYERAVGSGTGQRNSAVESWLGGTVVGKEGNAQSVVDAKGNPIEGGDQDWAYLHTDETNPVIAQNRHFQDQNEMYKPFNDLHGNHFGPMKYWPMRYRQANLRILQMRRNHAWMERNSWMNPDMLNWMSLELGKQAHNSPDAWIALQMSPVYIGGGVKKINNIERWLHQRESTGATESTIRQDWGYNAQQNKRLPRDRWFTHLARTGKSIGIAIDDAFMVGAHDVAIKVTYHDVGREDWTLTYTKADGSQGSRKVSKDNSGDVETATFFIDGLNAAATGFDADFRLNSAGADTPFMFVRVIKLDPGSFDIPIDPGIPPPGPGPGLPPDPGPGLPPGPGPGPDPGPPGQPPSAPTPPVDLRIVP